MDTLSPGRARRGWFALAGIVLLATTGCVNMLAAIGYITEQDTIAPDAKLKQLSGKRIAVVCRPVEQLQYADSSAAPDLAAAVGSLLTEHVKKCRVISPSDVAEWADQNDWREYSEIGKALKADIVIGIDLEQFGLNQGQTLYQGTADVHIWVYDMKTGKRIWDKKLPPTVYPPSTPIASSELSESEFRRKYIGVLADHIGRFFYEYDPRADFASDASATHD